MDIKKLNKKFDVIESVGVLHHMGDPLQGWSVLSDCLKKDSIMLVGLYSETARKILLIYEKINYLNTKITKKHY